MDTVYAKTKASPETVSRSILFGKRILVCGKGGSGKSTVITLLANALSKKKFEVVILDGDASNPGGLARLLFGLKEGVKPLIDFFGGREKVECPVDDPSILTRLNDKIPITKKLINISEIPEEYYVQRNGITLLQVGKINQPFEGCDGPLSKVARDFILEGDAVTLIDVEAGIEHYGRGIEKNVDIVIVVVDPTFESILIAQKVSILCQGMGIKNYGIIINKISTNHLNLYIEKELIEKGLEIYGSIKYDDRLFKAGLIGSSTNPGTAIGSTTKIVQSIMKAFT
jgi:CO dehydrogenase maturation factor